MHGSYCFEQTFFSVMEAASIPEIPNFVCLFHTLLPVLEDHLPVESDPSRYFAYHTSKGPIVHSRVYQQGSGLDGRVEPVAFWGA